MRPPGQMDDAELVGIVGIGDALRDVVEHLRPETPTEDPEHTVVHISPTNTRRRAVIASLRNIVDKGVGL